MDDNENTRETDGYRSFKTGRFGSPFFLARGRMN